MFIHANQKDKEWPRGVKRGTGSEGRTGQAKRERMLSPGGHSHTRPTNSVIPYSWDSQQTDAVVCVWSEESGLHWSGGTDALKSTTNREWRLHAQTKAG